MITTTPIFTTSSSTERSCFCQTKRGRFPFFLVLASLPMPADAGPPRPFSLFFGPVDDAKPLFGAAGERGRRALMPARTYLRDPARAARARRAPTPCPSDPFHRGEGQLGNGRARARAVWRTKSRREPLSETFLKSPAQSNRGGRGVGAVLLFSLFFSRRARVLRQTTQYKNTRPPRMKFPLLGVFLRKPFADAV